MNDRLEPLEVTIPEAMKLLRSGRGRVERYCREGRLRYRYDGGRNGRRILIDLSSIREYLAGEYAAQRVADGVPARGLASAEARASAARMVAQLRERDGSEA